MNKKILSLAVAAAVSVSTVVFPIHAEINDTITVTYYPKNYVIRYGGQYSHSARNEIAVNTAPYKLRNDQDDYFSQYEIAAPDAIQSVKINIPKLPLKLKTVKDEETGAESIQEAIMGMSIYYNIQNTELPADGEYYLVTESDAGTTAVGGDAEYVDNLLKAWNNRLFYNILSNPVLVDPIKPSTFGITNATTTQSVYDVTYDITDTVKDGLIDTKNNNISYLEVLYGASTTFGIWGKGNSSDYYANGHENWAENTTLEIEYDINLLLNDINSAATAEDLKTKIEQYSPMLGYSSEDFNPAVINERIENYAGTVFTWDTFVDMIEDMKIKNMSEYYLDIDKYLTSDSFAKIGDKADPDTWYSSTYTVDWAGQAVYSNGYFNCEIRDYEYNDETGEYSFNTTGETVKFDVSAEKLNGGVLDNVVVTGTDEHKSVEINSVGQRSERAYFLMASNGAACYPIITVNYTDGTKVTKNYSISGYYWAADSNIQKEQRYPDLAGYMFGSWNQLDAAKVNVDDTFLTVKDKDGNQTCGIPVYSMELDPFKKVKSYTFENANAEDNYQYRIFAITEKTLTNDEISQYIENIDFDTAADQEIINAAVFADELVARRVGIKSDYAAVYAAYDSVLEENGITAVDGKDFYVKDTKIVDEDGYEIGALKGVTLQNKTLSNLAYKLNNKEDVSVAYVGGSLTFGSGDSANCWRVQNMRWFEENYPDVNFNFRMCSIGGVGSNQHLYRIQKMVMDENPDVVFIDTAVNDSNQNETTHIRNMEGIIRQILYQNPYAEIILVDLTTKPIQDSDDLPNTYYKSYIVESHERLADYYGLSIINAGKYLYEKIYSGELIEVGDSGSISHNTEEAKKYAYLSSDTVHPTTGGYTAYADCIDSSIGNMLSGLQPEKMIEYVMPAKYDKDSYSTYTLITPDEDCITYNGFNLTSGAYVGDWTNVPMITYSDNNAQMTVEFTGTLFGFTWLNQNVDNTTKFNIDIDGKSYSVTPSSPYASWQSQFTTVVTGLSNTKHTAVITVDSSNTSYSTRIYGFMVSEDNDRVEKMGKITSSVAIPEFTLANIGDNDIAFDTYTGVYDENGKLVNISKIDNNILAKQLNGEFNGAPASAEGNLNTIKTFFWEKDSMIPLNDPVLVTE